MARRGAWIGMALAVPATLAFTPAAPPPSPPPSPPTNPQVAVTQPVVAVTAAPAAPATPQALPPATPQAPPTATPQALPPGPASLPAPDRDVGGIVVDAALSRVGAPYAWAAAGPDAFDCSGLVVWAFHQAGLNLPHSSEALAAGGQAVPLDQIQPGDVIIYFPDASHVGIYVGGRRMIHAPFDGAPVAVEWLRDAPIKDVRRYS